MSRRALVTGASSGLGHAVAVELGRRGFEVALLARNEQRLEATAADVREAGGGAIVVSSDVTDEARLLRDLDAALGRHGALDVVVHAAGVLDLAPIEELDAERVARLLRVNVGGTVACTRACLDPLARSRGALVLVCSVAGLFPLPGGFAGYAASKFGVRGWAEVARPELAARGVSLTVAYPSILDTPMVSTLDDRPPVYRAFPWHDCERAARRLVADALRGRRESYVSASDRAAAWASGAFPHAFAAGLRGWVGWKQRS